jgi:hypothetical protein
MTLSFVNYLILGFVGVQIFGAALAKFMQNDVYNYKGKDHMLLFLTRDISNEGRVWGPRIFTLWNLSHVLYFAIGSYLYPDKRLLLWFLGLIWELLETGVRIANPLDIMWNTIGILIGAAVRNKTL